MRNVGVFSSVYNCYLAPEEAVYSYYYKTHIPKNDAFFCYFDDFDSFITDYDPRFHSYYYEGDENKKYAKPWYKFNEFGFDSLVNSENMITLLCYDYLLEDYKIKAIIKFKDAQKYEEFKRLEDKIAQSKFLRKYTAMGYYYINEKVEIDTSNNRIKQLADIFNPHKLSNKEYNIIKQEINSADFFVIT